MSKKPQLEETEQPPVCPHCKSSLRKLQWHKVQGGPGMIGYLVLLSCPSCKVMLGTAGT